MADQPDPDDTRLREEFLGVLQHFEHAMLVTQRGGQLRSRPMEIVDRTAQGHVWFLTSIDSAKLAELTEHAHVNVAMQQDSRFLSISGTTRVTGDAAKIDEVWKAEHAVWFEQGRDDPELVLIEVVPLYAEYWDRSGVDAAKFAFQMARSLFTGEPLDDDAGVHGKLPFAR
jgi:general stress protein 26